MKYFCQGKLSAEHICNPGNTGRLELHEVKFSRFCLFCFFLSIYVCMSLEEDTDYRNCLRAICFCTYIEITADALKTLFDSDVSRYVK